MSHGGMEATGILVMAQLLAAFDRSLLAVPLTTLASRLGVHRETARRACPAVEQAIQAALAARRPGRPRKQRVPDDGGRLCEALKLVNQILLYVLRELVGQDWYRRLPDHMRARLGAWVDELRLRCAVDVAQIAAWLGVGCKLVQRWVQFATKGPREPIARPDVRALWATVASWYRELRNLPPHRRLSQRRFVGIFNRVFAGPLERLGIKRITRPDASRIERGLQIHRLGRRMHPRGTFEYPAPFQQAAIDTTYLDIGPYRFYLIALLDVGARVVLFQEVFVAESTGAVLEVLDQTAARFGLAEYLLIDRGTPYLNDQVKTWLRERGVRRIVCRPASPTEKACLERYNGTFQRWVLPQAHEVGVHLLDRDAVLSALRLAARLAWLAYNTQPQPFIDGKSPLERLEQHPLAKAARQRLQLELRSVESAPRKELLAHVRDLLQLDVDAQRLAALLGGFKDAAIRKAALRCAERFGRPDSPIDRPLPYFLAVVQRIDDELREAHARTAARQQQTLEERARQQARDLDLAARRDLEAKHPEQALWTWIPLLIAAIKDGLRTGLYLDKVTTLLGAIRTKLGPDLYALELAAILDAVKRTTHVSQTDRPDRVPIPDRAREQVLELLSRHGQLDAKGGAGTT